MKKKLATLLLATALSSSMVISAFAGEWEQAGNEWKYNENETYVTGWQWIDGNGDGVAECYYFDGNGYMLANTTTPDGYTVESSGAWVVNGVVQTQNTGNASTGKINVASYGYTDGVSNIAIEMVKANRADLVAKYGAESIYYDMGRGRRAYAYANIPFHMEYWIGTQYADQIDNAQSGEEVKALGGGVYISGSPSNMIEGLSRDNLSKDEMYEYLKQFGFTRETQDPLYSIKSNGFALEHKLWDYPGYEILELRIK